VFFTPSCVVLDLWACGCRGRRVEMALLQKAESPLSPKKGRMILGL
jgi:hypothetical protein